MPKERIISAGNVPGPPPEVPAIKTVCPVCNTPNIVLREEQNRVECVICTHVFKPKKSERI